MQVKDAIANRPSIRRYAQASIPPEHMRIMFQALQLAPSANNYIKITLADPSAMDVEIRDPFN